MDETIVTHNMIVFPQTVHGAWTVNASIFQKNQIMIMARSRTTDSLMIEVFYDPESAAEFIEYLDLSEDYNG